MNVVNLCREKEVLPQYRNGTQTNKDIVEYQRQYRQKKKKKHTFTIQIYHTNTNETHIHSAVNKSGQENDGSI